MSVQLTTSFIVLLSNSFWYRFFEIRAISINHSHQNVYSRILIIMKYCAIEVLPQYDILYSSEYALIR